MYYLSYKMNVMWIQIGARMCVSFFLIFKSKKCDVRRGLSSRCHGYSNCIIMLCVHYVRHIWHAWYVRIWLSILVLNHVTKMFQFTKQQYCTRLWIEQSLYDLKTYYFIILSSSSPLCTQYTQSKHNFILWIKRATSFS